MSTIYLVLYIYAGMLAKGDSVSMISIPQPTIAQCQIEGEKAKALVGGSTKELRFICVKGS